MNERTGSSRDLGYDGRPSPLRSSTRDYKLCILSASSFSPRIPSQRERWVTLLSPHTFCVGFVVSTDCVIITWSDIFSYPHRDSSHVGCMYSASQYLLLFAISHFSYYLSALRHKITTSWTSSSTILLLVADPRHSRYRPLQFSHRIHRPWQFRRARQWCLACEQRVARC